MPSGERLSLKRMKFRLSIHAQEQLADRRLPFQLLQIVLENPQQIIEEDGIKIYQSQFDRDGKLQLFRVFVDDSFDPVVVVTIYVTSKIAKYWRSS